MFTKPIASLLLGLALGAAGAAAMRPALALTPTEADRLTREQVAALRDIAQEIARLRDVVRECHRR
jgi:hypothetical protein